MGRRCTISWWISELQMGRVHLPLFAFPRFPEGLPAQQLCFGYKEDGQNGDLAISDNMAMI